jgi:hypothetical protein
VKPALPETREALEVAGYQFSNRARCAGCGRTIEWWRKVPGPPTPVEEFAGVMVNHFVTCEKREQFRKQAAVKHIIERRLSKKQETEQKRKEKARLKEEAKGGRLFE